MAVSFVGCGGDDSPERADLTGIVSFDGNTVEAGSITFIPDNSQGNKGPATNATITGGVYTTTPGKGAIGGPHIARISAFDGKADVGNEMPFGAQLFPEYEMKVDLPAPDGSSEPKAFDIEVPKEAADPPKKKRPVEQV